MFIDYNFKVTVLWRTKDARKRHRVKDWQTDCAEYNVTKSRMQLPQLDKSTWKSFKNQSLMREGERERERERERDIEEERER